MNQSLLDLATNVETAQEAPESVTMITEDQMIEMLMAEAKGFKWLGVTFAKALEKSGDMRKGGRNGVPPNPFWGDVVKVTRFKGDVCFDYEKLRERVGDEMKLAERAPEGKRKESWHTPVLRENGTLTVFSRHKMNPRRIYLRFGLEPKAVMKTHFMRKNGEALSRDELKPWLPKKSPTCFICISIENIAYIRWGGEVYGIKR